MAGFDIDFVTVTTPSGEQVECVLEVADGQYYLFRRLDTDRLLDDEEIADWEPVKKQDREAP
jgi:hypothetical protein